MKPVFYLQYRGGAGPAVLAVAQTPAPQTGATTAPPTTREGPPPPAAPDPNSQYRLGPDSMPQDGVPKGEIRGPFTLPSKVYPGTQHTYWVYVPAQYDPAVPASLMIFQDGQAFKDENGDAARAERDGQPDLPARNSGDDRRLHQSRAARRTAGADAAGTGATGPPIGRRSTTRPTTSTRALSSKS